MNLAFWTTKVKTPVWSPRDLTIASIRKIETEHNLRTFDLTTWDDGSVDSYLAWLERKTR